MDKDAMKLVPGGAASEANQALINLKHILAEANISYNNGKSNAKLMIGLVELTGLVLNQKLR